MVVGFALFKDRPTSKQFFCGTFKRWCRRRSIRPRFGAVGKHGSIAIIERFIRPMKSECTRRILVPFDLTAVRRELSLYVGWYNEHRPQAGLGGRTPLEVYQGLPPANEAPRFEPRTRWPRRSSCARPVVPVKERPGTQLALVFRRFEGQRHLPVIALKPAA